MCTSYGRNASSFFLWKEFKNQGKGDETGCFQTEVISLHRHKNEAENKVLDPTQTKLVPVFVLVPGSKALYWKRKNLEFLEIDHIRILIIGLELACNGG